MSTPLSPSQNVAALEALSRKLGQDPFLVQAGGGNTSLKDGGTLWIKASGKWMVRAGEEEMFLPVPLDEVHACVDRGVDYTEEQRTASGAVLRPSVETTMHAVLPQRVVIHVHSVNTLVWAVQPEGPEQLRKRLDGLRWEWIPYVHPGVPLARRIRESLVSRPDVLVLENHGLVVAGETCEAAEELLSDVEQRLRLPARPARPGDPAALTRIADGSAWRPAPWLGIHALATDAFSCAIASGGTLYPDHCVYLGPAVCVVEEGESILEATRRYETNWGRLPSVVLVPTKGVLVTQNLTRAAEEMLFCLQRVVERIPAGARVQYLSAENVSRLINWDAERYRIAIAREQERQQTKTNER
jgi:Uncharacterized conserved protein